MLIRANCHLTYIFVVACMCRQLDPGSQWVPCAVWGYSPLTKLPEEGLPRCGEFGVEEEEEPKTLVTWGGDRV